MKTIVSEWCNCETQNPSTFTDPRIGFYKCGCGRFIPRECDKDLVAVILTKDEFISLVKALEKNEEKAG